VQRLAGHRDLRTTQRYVDALKRSHRPVSSLLRTVFSEIRDELDAAA
jgi:site-specific recombinase XerD